MNERKEKKPLLNIILHIENKNILISLFFLSFAVRLLYIYSTGLNPLITSLLIDALSYDRWARKIAGGDWLGSEVFYQDSLYPYLIAVIYKISGYSITVVKIFQAALSSFTCIIIYRISKQVFNRHTGVIAGILFAFYSPLIFYDGMLLKSSVEIFSISLLILSLITASERPILKNWFISGIFFGIAALARGNIFIFLPFIIAYIFLKHLKGLNCLSPLTLTLSPKGRGKGERERANLSHLLKEMTGLLAGIIIIVSPVTIRNYIVGDDFVLTTAHTGINFYIGNNPEATGVHAPPQFVRTTPEYEKRDSKRYAEKEMGRELSPSEVSKFWLSKTIEFIKREPHRYLQLLLTKFKLIWSSYEVPDNGTDYNILKKETIFLRLLSFSIIAPMGISGIFLSFKKRKRVAVLYLFSISYVISLLLTYITSRYRLPIIIPLLIFASFYIYHIYLSIKQRKIKQTLLPLITFITLFFLITHREKELSSSFAPHIHNNIGLAYLDLDRYEDAIREFNIAISLYPELAETYFNLGSLYLRQGLDDKAIQSFKRGISVKDYDPDAHLILGYIYTKKDRYKDAIREYEKVIKIDAKNPDAYQNLGNIYYKTGDMEMAIRYWKRSLEIDPENRELKRFMERM
ncbi:MAG: tetratricopeptide repeat protein [Nitrospirota bacterium]